MYGTVCLRDDSYAARIESYWCNNANLRPSCIVQSHSVEELSKAVAALAKAHQHFAVRAGGHTNWAGSNNITNGVTIDLGFLDVTNYDDATQVAHIGPGAKWKDVRLSPGRWKHFPHAALRLACDQVIAYEVFLANGKVIAADARGEHTDLFRVLKGRGSNFGIVTRFSMQTLPIGPIWGGLALYRLNFVPTGIKALVEFTDSAVPLEFPSRITWLLSRSPPCSARSWRCPKFLTNYKTTTLQELLTYSSLPPNYYNIWFTLTIKNDVSILLKAAELHNEMAKELQEHITDQVFTSHFAFQPGPRLYVEQSHANNITGHVLGLEQNTHDAILIQAFVSVRTAEL
ncbi:hypothetical protein JX265_009814 [Neoarthrinium moseri]|uniref:FAD-binding PCMH-type domain-containing protein n=1 Tax=Neoarthrinium moseri TaxID=1658444 RepID=A0A9Q0AIU1_9PEZI|nr:hypothetical protein JX265_009814 [Neoarthrinium moseri]